MTFSKGKVAGAPLLKEVSKGSVPSHCQPV